MDPLNEDAFPIENGDFPASYVRLPEGTQYKDFLLKVGWPFPKKTWLLALFFGPNWLEVRNCQPKLEENDENMIYLEAQGKSPILNETPGRRVQGGPQNPTISRL